MEKTSLFHSNTKCGFSHVQNCEVSWICDTESQSPEKKIVTCLHLSKLNSLQSQYHLFYIVIIYVSYLIIYMALTPLLLSLG